MVAAAALLVTSLAVTPHAHAASVRPLDSKALLAAGQNRAEWLMHGRTYDEQRFSPLAQIDT